MTLQGKGMKNVDNNNRRGALHVTFDVVFPSELDAAAKAGIAALPELRLQRGEGDRRVEGKFLAYNGLDSAFY